jgi:hypothetical protein
MTAGPDGSLIPWRSRTAAGGTAVPPRRGPHSSPPPFPGGPIGPYQLHAAIAALHDERRAPKRQTGPRSPPSRRPAPLGRQPGRRARPRRRHQHGRRTPGRPRAGPGLGTDPRVNADPRFYAVRGHLLLSAGHPAPTLEAYRAAARVATNLQQGACAPDPAGVSNRTSYHGSWSEGLLYGFPGSDHQAHRAGSAAAERPDGTSIRAGQPSAVNGNRILTPWRHRFRRHRRRQRPGSGRPRCARG